MEEIKVFMADNPQVSASMITAVCGILGIFINIAINIYFRNHDYKNKNRMNQIENMELYYLPLREKLEHTIELANSINVEKKTSIFNILAGEMGATHAQAVSLFENSLEDLQKHFDNVTYRFQDNFKLFKIHRKVKNTIWGLCRHKEKKIEDVNDISLKDLIKELKELVYRIQCCEAKIFSKSFYCGLWEYFVICRTYKKTK